MTPVLIFGGTTEGRQLAELLAQAEIACTVCVATEYGEQVMPEDTFIRVRQGRMNAMEMRAFMQAEAFQAVVDATHPFARIVTQTIKESLQGLDMPYLRLKRDMQTVDTSDQVRWFADMESCVKALEQEEGNILLTTGSKDLHKFAVPSLRERLYVRVLPSMESISLCEQCGFHGKQILALQGPFTTAMNEAMIEQYQIAILVTKETGAAGGFFEKVEAVSKSNIQCMVIGNPEAAQPGYALREVAEQLFVLLKKPMIQPVCTVYLAGMGMGNMQLLTGEVKEAIQKADVVFGAKRLLEQIPTNKKVYPYYVADEIIPVLHQLLQETDRLSLTAVVMLSGDTGFYSGANHLVQRLHECSLNMQLRVLPGLSSMSYLAAKLQISWHDAKIISIHGRHANVPDIVRYHPKTFLLLSKLAELHELGAALTQLGMGDARISFGYQLSYPEESIQTIAAKDCGEVIQEGLYCCFIFHSRAQKRILTPSLPDKAFIRGDVPMTKEEVRAISIAKLQLHKDAILYDIGSGTGSVAVASALLSDRVQIYAIERNPEAISLIKQNCQRHGVSNVTVVEATAPAGMDQLPIPTHVFFGGSGGRLREIVELLVACSQPVRVVFNAITLESIGAVQEILQEVAAQDIEMVQVQVSRARKLGGYHLMQAENPVMIVSCVLNGADEV